MGHQDHHDQAKDTPVRCAVLTVSDTRTESTDTSGRYIREALKARNLPVTGYQIAPDDSSVIVAAIKTLSEDAEVILINGGTGISRRDTTFEAIQSIIEKSLPGFGEIFRMLSFDDIGPAVMLSRASAGIAGDTLLFSMPGSTGAVRLAMEKLILPEMRHLVWELIRQPRQSRS